MQKKFLFLSVIFLALISMPFDVFAAENYGTKMFKGNGFGDFEDWVADTFCNSSAMDPLYNFGCGLTQYIQCTQAYKQEVRNKDSNLYKSLQNVLSVFSAACNDNSGQILNNFDSIETNGVNFTGIVCQSGYTHPDSSVNLYKYRCIKQSNANSGQSATATNIGSTYSGNAAPYAMVSPDVASNPRATTPVQNAPVPKATINNQADITPESAKTSKFDIQNSITTIKVGDYITYNDSDYKYLSIFIGKWEDACKKIVARTYPGAEADPEAEPAGKGKSKKTCYIRSCGREDLQVSRNRKSCEQTAEAKKLEKEYSKKDNRVDDLIAKINNTQVKIGASITIPSAMNGFETVTAAKEAWADKCIAIKNDTVKEASIDYSPDGNTLTCVIEECNQSGYAVSNNRLKCEQTAEAKKLEKKYSKNDTRVNDLIAKINNTQVKIGASITIPSAMNGFETVTAAKEAWADKCIAIKNDTVKEASIDYSPDGNTLTCVIVECTQKISGYYPSGNGLKCEQTKEGKKSEKRSEDIQKIVNKINDSASSIKIGASITIPSNMNLNDNVVAAKEAWADKCIAIKNDTVKEASIDYSPDGNTLTCVIEECNQSGYAVSNNRLKCEITKEEKQRQKDQDIENNKDICGGRNGTWDDKKGCLCNGKKMENDESECIPDKTKDNCKASTDAEWKINKCVCKDKNFVWSNKDQKCVTKSGECKDIYGKGVGRYDENGKCKLTDCEDKNYTLNENKNKCELKTTANIRNKKVQTALEKEFIADVNKLISAFNTVAEKYKPECSASDNEGQS